MTPNPFIERTGSGTLRVPTPAAHVERSPRSRRDRSTSDGNDMLKAATAAGRMLGLETQLGNGVEAMR